MRIIIFLNYTSSDLAWVTNNNSGSTSAALVSAMVIASGNIGGIINAYLYPKSHSPDFLIGNGE